MNHHIVAKVNRKAQTERENIAIDEMEKQAAPFFYLVLGCALLVIVGNMMDEYADSKHAGSIQTEKVMADCMNGKAIQADGSILRCEVVNYALVGAK